MFVNYLIVCGRADNNDAFVFAHIIIFLVIFLGKHQIVVNLPSSLVNAAIKILVIKLRIFPLLQSKYGL